MTTQMTLTFTPDGTGHCLYGELVELRTIGTLSCRRASHIEFDLEAQQWQVLSPDRRNVLFAHDSRTICLEWEQQNLQPA